MLFICMEFASTSISRIPKNGNILSICKAVPDSAELADLMPSTTLVVHNFGTNLQCDKIY